MSTNLFRVTNWDKYQHYKDDRPIQWIKLYQSLLSDYLFCQLPDCTKAHFVLILLLASKLDNKIPHDSTWLANQLSATEPIDIDLLLAYDFIEELPGQEVFVRNRTNPYESVRNRTKPYETVRNGTPRALAESRVEKSREEKKRYSSQAFGLATRLLELILANDPKAKKPKLERWAEDIDKLHRLDKRSYEEIEGVMVWAQNDSFWRSNILSASSLRKQFAKLKLQMEGTNGNGKQANIGGIRPPAGKYDHLS